MQRLAPPVGVTAQRPLLFIYIYMIFHILLLFFIFWTTCNHYVALINAVQAAFYCTLKLCVLASAFTTKQSLVACGCNMQHGTSCAQLKMQNSQKKEKNKENWKNKTVLGVTLADFMWFSDLVLLWAHLTHKLSHFQYANLATKPIRGAQNIFLITQLGHSNCSFRIQKAFAMCVRD